MEVGDAAGRRGRRALDQDGPPQQWPSGAHHLRDRAAKVVAANAIDALQGAQQLLAARTRVRRCDADNRPACHDKHDREVRERGDRASRDPLNRFLRGTGGGGRDLRSRSNRLDHG
jgi:hypothetical protein